MFDLPDFFFASRLPNSIHVIAPLGMCFLFNKRLNIPLCVDNSLFIIHSLMKVWSASV